MTKQEVFQIIRNYRVTRVIKHRMRKSVPPISIQTRRMAKSKDILDTASGDFNQEASQSLSQDFMEPRVVLKDLTSQDPLQFNGMKDDEIDSTPFGQHHFLSERLDFMTMVEF